jgi:hypothetical protein
VFAIQIGKKIFILFFCKIFIEFFSDSAYHAV